LQVLDSGGDDYGFQAGVRLDCLRRLLLRVQTNHRRKQGDNQKGSAKRAPNRSTFIVGALQEPSFYRPDANIVFHSSNEQAMSGHCGLARD
jgi:hypothetical protein